MQRTPSTRHRHALRWVLGVGLVFVVVVGMALQVARGRALDEWNRVVAHLQDADLETTDFGLGGNYIRAYRYCSFFGRRRGFHIALTLVQDRTFFGTEMRLWARSATPEEADALRAILAAVDVTLVVEP